MTSYPTTRTKLIATGIVVALLVAAAGTWGYLEWRHCKLMSTLVRVCYDTTLMHTGDLVFRNGLGNESLLVTTTSNGEYSHVGIALSTPSGWQVIHAVPGEAAPGEPEYVKCEPIEEFFDPHRARAGGMARVDCDSLTALAAARAAMGKVTAKVTFDNDYNLEDTTQLYCTELVRLAYMNQGIDLADDRWAPTPGINTTGRIVYPEHLWQSPRLARRYEFQVKPVE